MIEEINKTIEPGAESEKNNLSSDGQGVIQENPGEKVELSEEWVLEKIDNAKEEALKNAKNEAEKAIREQVQTDKASLITVFGIFASIISFLTIEFQFLKTLCSFEKILGFTLILFSLLFGFNIALDYLVKSRTDMETPVPNKYFILLIVFVFIMGIIFSFRGNEYVCVDNKIYQKYNIEFSERSDNLYNQYDGKIKNITSRMEKLEKINAKR